MKILRNASIIILGLIVILLIAGNIFYSPIRTFLESGFLKIELNGDESARLNEADNSDYQLKIETDKKVYQKFEKIKLFARIEEKTGAKAIPENAVIRAEFYNNGEKIKNIDGDDSVALIYYKDQQTWIGYYFPENPGIEGKIDIEASGFIDSPIAPVAAKNSFVINETGPKFVLDKGQVFLGIDSPERVSKRNILSVEGKEVDWNYIPEWVNFISADGIIMLSGITRTYENVTLDSPWDNDKLNESTALAGMISKRNKHFGVYARCLNADGGDTRKIGYKTVLYFKGDSYGEDSSYISLLDDSRKKSIVKLLSSFMDNENISYVGMSDIFMPVNYGAELIDNYFRDCGISVPGNWDSLDFDGKFGFFKNKMKDSAGQNRFNMWKLYFIADYIRDTVEKIGHKKPIFYRMDYKLLMDNPSILPALISAGIDFVIVDFNIGYDKIPEGLDDMSKNPFISQYINRLIISYYFDYQNVDENGFDISAIENYVSANLQLLKNGSSSRIANGILINDLYQIMSQEGAVYSQRMDARRRRDHLPAEKFLQLGTGCHKDHFLQHQSREERNIDRDRSGKHDVGQDR